MFIQYGYEITILCLQPTPIITRLDVHPEVAGRSVETIPFNTSSNTTVEEFRDDYGNRARRLVAPPGPLTLSAQGIISDDGLLDFAPTNLAEIAVQNLSPEVLPFLLASRYCDTDLLSERAWTLFGNVQPGGPRVQAICDYVHDRVRFDYAQARSTRTASEANAEQVGVCRDYAHLAIAFCRCLNIPARYVNGYLGDIGVPFNPSPMDFSAWFEAYIEIGRAHV